MDYNDQMKNRLRRVQGQVRGIIKMMDSQRDHDDVVNQLSAIRSAIERVIMYVAGENMQYCIREELMNGGESVHEVLEESIHVLK
ncbi:metal-sensing transcriptional repressor [Alicyclobacillus sp. SO9]|uniref:metal-sensing transcriptional repressor n=1 Tax=Alicyclobacillus sp. SO9 TaxID=2665646 RepID=UPI0018E83135|nr:metal-sensing transcriptional repressor [Alicyclobacillus sp. SO9]QQE78424.1 metal-sensing transcriptional repressor [Alicyclobacillus sp. SO9]